MADKDKIKEEVKAQADQEDANIREVLVEGTTENAPKNPQSSFADLTVKELQAEAVKLGMPEEDVKTFTIKAPLIATINALKANAVIKKVDTLEVPANPKEEKQTEKKWQSKADRMCDYLEGRPKVAILIPCEAGEKPGVVNTIEVRGRKQYVYVSGAVWSKTFNGYKIIVPKGVQGVLVADDIAKNIADEYNLTQAAGEQWKIDRIDPTTGKPVKEQLS